jgi:membrane protein implicated in regulation of membrane protease activity
MMMILKRVAAVGGFLVGLLVVLLFIAVGLSLLILSGVPWPVMAVGVLFTFCAAVWLVMRFRSSRREAGLTGFSETAFSDRSAGKGGLL